MKVKAIPRPKGLAFPETTVAEHSSIRAMSQGAATPQQQMLFYDYIIKKAGMIGGISFHPDNKNLTDFSEGRRFVAAAVIHFTIQPIKES